MCDNEHKTSNKKMNIPNLPYTMYVFPSSSYFFFKHCARSVLMRLMHKFKNISHKKTEQNTSPHSVITRDFITHH